MLQRPDRLVAVLRLQHLPCLFISQPGCVTRNFDVVRACGRSGSLARETIQRNTPARVVVLFVITK